MSFPTSPTNGQVSIINGISYIYSSATNSWARSSVSLPSLSVWVDTFTGDGVTTTFSLSVTPANINMITVNIDGVFQQKSAFTLSSNILSLTGTPISGAVIEVRTTNAFPASVLTGLTLDSFVGDGSTANFTLSQTPTTKNFTLVSLGGVVQQKTTYNTTNNVLTFSTAPALNAPIEVTTFGPAISGSIVASGSDTQIQYNNSGSISASATLAFNYSTSTLSTTNANITGTLTSANANVTGTFTANNFSNVYTYTGNVGIGTSTPAASLDMSNRTDMMLLPSGTTSQRPANANVSVGGVRFNTSLGLPEWFSPTVSTWLPFYQASSYNINFLVVAGGGGGGGGFAGGGGAGGMLTGSATVTAGSAFTIQVGAGGAGGVEGAAATAHGANGSPSFAFTGSCIGGGGGGGWTGSDNYANNNLPNVGWNGGSGGGDSSKGSLMSSGTTGQGHAGGAGQSDNSSYDYPGGGGGAGTAGGNLTAGAGLQSSITGTAVYYAGGGGGYGTAQFNGGSGGGGNGASPTGGAGTAFTGGGGGGGSTTGGQGGSGVVIVSYVSQSQRGSGGTVTSYGSGASTTWVHTFTTSGTFTA